MPYLYRPEVLNLRDTALSYRPQDSNVTVKNEDDVSYSIGEASAFVVMLTKNVEAAEYEPFNFKLDKRSEEHNALAYSWDWLVWAAKQGKPVGIQPNTPQHLNAVWSDKSTKIEVEPSVILDTGHHVWLLDGVESGPDSFDRLRRLAPGFDILGFVPLPGIAAKIIAKRCTYYTLEDLERKSPEPTEPTPPEPKTKAELFVDRVMSNLREKFKAWEHSPSRDHMAGLESIANVFSAMVTGEADSKRFISSLPTGMGKTSTLTECTKLLCSEAQETGVVIFLERLAEIRKLVADMNLKRDQFACLTSDEEINAMGRGSGNVGDAQILFTTQNRLERLSVNKGSFASISEFYYQGQPRPIRVWDEAINPSKVLVVDRKAVQGVLGEMPTHSKQQRRLWNVLDDWSSETRDLKTGDQTTVPDLNLYGVESLESWLSDFDMKNRDTAEALWYLSGRTARIRRDSETSRVTLDYEDILPEDLKPFLVLDASGGLRAVYALEDEAKGQIEWLYSPPKSYGGLTVHHWDIGAGKSSQLNTRRQDELLQGVAETINAVPGNEQILVIHHKPKRRAIDWPEELAPLCFGKNLRFLHWGQHTATNEFARVKYVFVVGLLNYNPSQYEAQGRAAKNITYEQDLTEAEFNAVRRGEIKHNLFQAVSRGAVRRAIGDQCPKGVHLYIACSTHHSTGIDRAIFDEVFPGCSVERWDVQRKAKGKVKEALNTIALILAEAPRASFVAVREAIGMDSGTFNNKVVQHHDFGALLAEQGWTMVRQRGRGGSWFERS